MILTEDHRLLLYGMGGWPIVGALGDPEYGIPHLFQSYWTSTCLHSDVLTRKPDWAHCGFTTRTGKVSLWPLHDKPVPIVSVTGAQLRKYATTLPRAVVDELRSVRRGTDDQQAAALRKAFRLDFADEPTDLLELLAMEACGMVTVTPRSDYL